MSATTTMLSTYDAQMMDYPSDIDVPMHSSNSESWYLGDLAMEDDPQTPNMHKTSVSVGADRTPIMPTIEVDMEDWAPEPVEYEMADEAEVPYEGGVPLDVEVYDVSQIHSPSGLDAPQVFSENVANQSHSISTSFSPDIEVAMLPETDGAVDEGQDVEPVEVVETLDDSSYGTVVEFPEAESTHFQTISEEEDPLANGRISSGSTLSLAYEDATAIDATNDPTVPLTEASEHIESVDNPETNISIHPALPPPPIDQPITSEDGQSVFIGHDSNQAQEEYSHELAVEEETTEGLEQQQEPDNHQNSTDPHEISEGVYIDPPPAVLLSFTLADDESEFYLFNQPAPKSGTSTPTAGSPHEQFKLLLHEKPTLYYETLTSVFDAFRMEPEIAQLPDFANGELVLNAYDLDLSISEDNIYAREISLHDLNVLHDGSKFTGPLRVHLHSVTPRFIFRYQELQYQIAHANTAAETGDSSNVGRHEPDDQYLGNISQNGEQATEESYGDHPEEHSERVQLDQPSHDVEEKNAHEEAVTGDISNPSSEFPENQGQTEETTYPTDVQAENIGADTQESEHDDKDQPSDASTIVDGSHTSSAHDLESREESYQRHQDHADVPTELPGNGELPPVDNEDEDEESENTEEERISSTGHQDIHESVSHQDGSHHEDEDASTNQGFSETPFVLIVNANTTVGLDHDEHLATELADPSHYDSEDFLGNNAGATSSHPYYVEQEEFGAEEFPVSDIHAAAGKLPAPLRREIPAEPSNDPEPYIVGHPDFDRQNNNAENREDDWDDELDGEAAFDDTWEFEGDVASNESSVTLSSSSSKRTFGQVEPDDEHDDGKVSFPSSRPKRLRSQYQPE